MKKIILAALLLAGCDDAVGRFRSIEVIECRKRCYPAQAVTPPLNQYIPDRSVACRCIWPASAGDAGVTDFTPQNPASKAKESTL
jgi:hypothetical protein